ncbi:unnamed protein product [Echinostoma caproni]|uniref:BMERB domain-containing protein n=1 Tax=Echinostoma caproni TaxID=27848 RepID=A0A183AMP0_9TREM|nr:unnamed protein product [Echinostoma caproni]
MAQIVSETGLELCHQSGDHDVNGALSNQLVKSLSLKDHMDCGDLECLRTNRGLSNSSIHSPPANGTMDHSAIDSSVSSASSHSPSPVRSIVASPYASATVRRLFRRNETPSVSDAIRTPFDSDLLSESTAVMTQLNQRPPQHEENYPEHLNPFSDEDPPTARLPVLRSTDSIVTPFDDLVNEGDDATRIDSPLMFSRASLSASKLRDSPSLSSTIPNRRQAPPRPPKPNESLLLRRNSHNRLNSIEPGTPRPLDRSQSLRGSRRSFSTGPRLDCNTHRMVHGDTKSVILKRQAPPLPVPGKRVIKADPEDEFISYGDLHRKLHEIHQKLTETERSSRMVHMRLKQGTAKHINVNELLEQWTKLADVKEFLLKQEASLLERLRRQELEEKHADLEHELRLLLAKQDALKTTEEKAREEKLLYDLVTTVEKRAELVDHLTEA